MVWTLSIPKINWYLRLCLFWVKSISGNAFPYLRVFGCARKMHFPEMLFSWPLNGCKLISVSILPSNSHFPENTKRAEWEGDAPARRERKREEEPRRARLRSSSPTASHPKTDRPRPRSSSPTASLDRPRPRSLSLIASPFWKTDHPRTRSLNQIVLEPVVEPSRDRNTNRLRRSRLSSNPVATELWIFFFWVLFVFLD